MKDGLLKIYQWMPHPLCMIGANLRGFYLQSQRYGPETERLVEKALERETWSPQKWQSWHEDQLVRVLHRAATKVPYYRSFWQERRRKGDKSSWEILENWPILEKEDVRENPKAFVAEDNQTEPMMKEHTSGTSGKPLQFWLSRRAVRKWYALIETRCRHWNGVSRKDRWAIVGGQMIKPVNQSKPPFWIWNMPMRQLYLSSFHISKNNISAYIEAIKKYKIQYLLGYSSSLSVLARQILDYGRIKLHLKTIVTNAEPLLDYQKNLIKEAFQCSVRESYGMTEIVAGASECHKGRLHLWPEVGWLELMTKRGCFPLGKAPEAGELIATSLLNEEMPLIRYRNGDRLNPNISTKPCLCGRLLPTIQNVEGRISDMIFAPDGRKIFWLNPVFYGLPIAESQMIQTSRNHLRILIVSKEDFDEKSRALLLGRVRERIGNVHVTLEKVETIPLDKNGKRRFIINQLSNMDINLPA